MKNQKGFAGIGIIVAVVAVLLVGGIAYYVGKNSNDSIPQNTSDNLVGNDRDEHGCLGSAGYSWCEVKNKCLRTWEEKCESALVTTNETANWKTYTNTKLGYSFQYPEKLYLDTPTITDSVFLSHQIPFENRDGGCDMKGDAELSKTLTDFGMSISIVSGTKNPPYVDGNYSKGILNGKWAYMGAEGCGQTNYYFPISDNRTLVVEEAQVQMLSGSATPETRAKLLAVPGVISNEESKTIFDQILSTFKFLNSDTTAENMTVQVYFSRTGDESAECDETGSVVRIIPKTVGVGTAALEELLKGPTAEEKANRYVTNIPLGSKLNSLVIKNGEARADFNAITESGGGSCSMAARTNQIVRTLLQFPTVKKVVLSIDGRTEDIFQP